MDALWGNNDGAVCDAELRRVTGFELCLPFFTDEAKPSSSLKWLAAAGLWHMTTVGSPFVSGYGAGLTC